MSRFILLLSLLVSMRVYGSESWMCTHPQLCQMIQDYYEQSSLPAPSLSKAIAATGDPHHLEPTSNEVKTMVKADVLLAAPDSLHPWSQAIVKMRQEAKARTLQFVSPSVEQIGLAGATAEALAHFWLYPKIHCDYWYQFHTWLGIKSMPPQCPYKEVEALLEAQAKKIKTPIILSHDALVPLLRSWGMDAHAIRGSGHHEEPRPAQLKNLEKLLQKHPQVIWIVESRIHFPKSIQNLQRKGDRRLELDTSGDFPKNGLSPLQRLQLLLAKL